jgi:hypothetical protein
MECEKDALHPATPKKTVNNIPALETIREIQENAFNVLRQGPQTHNWRPPAEWKKAIDTLLPLAERTQEQQDDEWVDCTSPARGQAQPDN